MFGFGKKTAQKRGTEADLDRFRTRNRTEIKRILLDLARRTELATVYFNGGKEFVLSAVVGFDPENRRVYLDYGADEEDNERLLKGEKRILVSNHNGVRVQFHIEAIARTEWEDHPAFVIAVPDTVIRVQRREFFRVDTPVATPLMCRFTTAHGYSGEATVVDLSLGGLGLIEPKDLPADELAVGETVRICRIELPGYGTIETAFEVRNAKPHKSGTGEVRRRVGCQFVEMEARTSHRLQRYINKLELERRRMAKDR